MRSRRGHRARLCRRRAHPAYRHHWGGHFEDDHEGILDRTHVKFYTLDTARELVLSAGLRIRDEVLLGTPPVGGGLRRLLVRGFRALSARATAQAFLFVAEPEAGRR